MGQQRIVNGNKGQDAVPIPKAGGLSLALCALIYPFEEQATFTMFMRITWISGNKDSANFKVQ